MATINALAPSNWEGTDAGRIEYSGETVGWLGSYYHSDGMVILNNCEATLGIRIQDISFAYSNIVNFGGWSNNGAYLTVVLGSSVHSGDIIFSGNIQGLTHQELPSYNELEIVEPLSLMFASITGWNSYMYNDGGGDGNSAYTFNLSALTFTYTEAAPPYLWRDYVNSEETIVV